VFFVLAVVKVAKRDVTAVRSLMPDMTDVSVFRHSDILIHEVSLIKRRGRISYILKMLLDN